MALFGESLTHEIVALVTARRDGLAKTLDSGELTRDLRLLVSVANGEQRRTDVIVHRVEAALTRVQDALFASTLGVRATPPAGFWQSDMGILISRARWWVSVDDLITISNAAAFAFGENTQANRMRISRAIDSGLLEWVPDPSVSNPQQNRRVLLSQVERLRDLKRLPE